MSRKIVYTCFRPMCVNQTKYLATIVAKQSPLIQTGDGKTELYYVAVILIHLFFGTEETLQTNIYFFLGKKIKICLLCHKTLL